MVAMLAREGFEVQRTALRGQGLVDFAVGGIHALVVVELSRLGEVGLRGLAAMSRQRLPRATVLLLPGGLAGPTAADLGIEAVLEERDVAGLREVARTWSGVTSGTRVGGGRVGGAAERDGEDEGAVGVDEVAGMGARDAARDREAEAVAAPPVE